MTKAKVTEGTVRESKFTKEQAYNSKRYKYEKDLISALLEDGQLYTVKEIDTLIEKYLKRKIK